MDCKTALLALILCVMASQVQARIEPSFSLQDAAWSATDIVVASEGEVVDGKLQVLETWKGDLKEGDSLNVPEMQVFAAPDKRTVRSLFTNNTLETVVTGARLVTFLIKPSKGSTNWKPASLRGGFTTAVVWIEQGQTYCYVQEMNPGPSLLSALGLSESALRAQVLDITKTQTSLAKTIALKDPAKRAKLLRPFLDSKMYYARKSAFAAMGQCGSAALPILRAMLNDKMATQRDEAVIMALGEAGGIKVGPEITQLVKTETQFWKQKAPYLKVGWWNGKGIDWAKVEYLRHRYTKLYAALDVLKKTKFAPCRQAVSKLRALWLSFPQLNDKSGLDQMSEHCTNVLNALTPNKK